MTEPVLYHRIVAAIRSAALAGKPCPSNARLAADLDVASGGTVSAALAHAEYRGLVTVERRSRRMRVVAAADGSWRTAEPPGWNGGGAGPKRRDSTVAAASAVRSPETALASAVVLQALRDLTLPFSTTGGSSSSTVAKFERLEAERFLLAERGEWAQAREYWCDMADIDPDVVRARALRIVGWRGGRTSLMAATAAVEELRRAEAPGVAGHACDVSSLDCAAPGFAPGAAAFSGAVPA